MMTNSRGPHRMCALAREVMTPPPLVELPAGFVTERITCRRSGDPVSQSRLVMRQSGQAMVEMVVISLVLVGLFLGIWYIGKFHDIQASTIQAARYAAWERTARGPAFTDARLASQTRARLFSWNQNAYQAQDGIDSGQPWQRQTSVWTDHASDKRLIDAPRDVTVSTAAGALPGLGASTINSTLGSLSSVTAGLTGGSPLPQGGKYTSTVSVKLANLAHMDAPLDKMNLTLTERSVIVTDSWDASSPREAALRTRSFTPGGVLKSIDDGFGSLIKEALALIEPSFKEFHPGQICPDVVPMDRITAIGGGRANQPVYRGARPCY